VTRRRYAPSFALGFFPSEATIEGFAAGTLFKSDLVRHFVNKQYPPDNDLKASPLSLLPAPFSPFSLSPHFRHVIEVPLSCAHFSLFISFFFFRCSLPSLGIPYFPRCSLPLELFQSPNLALRFPRAAVPLLLPYQIDPPLRAFSYPGNHIDEISPFWELDGFSPFFVLGASPSC